MVLGAWSSSCMAWRSDSAIIEADGGQLIRSHVYSERYGIDKLKFYEYNLSSILVESIPSVEYFHESVVGKTLRVLGASLGAKWNRLLSSHCIFVPFRSCMKKMPRSCLPFAASSFRLHYSQWGNVLLHRHARNTFPHISEHVPS